MEGSLAAVKSVLNGCDPDSFMSDIVNFLIGKPFADGPHVRGRDMQPFDPRGSPRLLRSVGSIERAEDATLFTYA